MRIRDIAILTVATLGSAPLAAQYVPRIPPPPEPTYQFFVGVNPLSIPFNIGSFEMESSLGQGATIGASAAYTELDQDRFSTAEAKLRFYPGGIPFRGFAFGVGAGLTRFSTMVNTPATICNGAPGLCGSDFNNTQTREYLDAPTMGMLADYDWTPNTRTHQFIVGLGVEAKRIIATDEDRNRLGLPTAYLSARFVIGLAF